MRKTTLIAGLVLNGFMMVLFFANTVHGAGLVQLVSAAGFSAGVLAVVASVFFLKRPTLSLVLYGVAALLVLSVAGTDVFPGMTAWAVLLMGLAVMSYFGRRDLQKRQAEAT